MTICAYRIKPAPAPASKLINVGEITEQIAERERNPVGDSILTDARANNQIGQIAVWHCGGLMCTLFCTKNQLKQPLAELQGAL